MDPEAPVWLDSKSFGSHAYVCGFCGLRVGSGYGWNRVSLPGGRPVEWIRLCPHCGRPTYFFDGDKQMPGLPFGAVIEHLPPEVESAYTEARNCMVVSAYTAAALLCRKILMNVAVSLGAAEGETFKYYLDYLATHGHVTAGSREWVGHLRDKGNEATHEIKPVGRRDAEDVLSFAEMLLRIIFDFPARHRDAKGTP